MDGRTEEGVRIGGLQKLTLLDYPGRVAATVFLEGCNFRCPFCHNGPLVEPHEATRAGSLSQDQVLAFLKSRQGRLSGICVSGGEPLMQPGLPAFLARIRSLGYAVKLDTNGAYPRRLQQLLEEGLVDYLAMDVKNVPGRYALTAGLPEDQEETLLATVTRSMDLLRRSGLPAEFRTTLVKEFHRLEDARALGRFVGRGLPYYLQVFSDSGQLLRPGLSGLGAVEMEAFRIRLLPSVGQVFLRGL